jgi:allophanate hydrolase
MTDILDLRIAEVHDAYANGRETPESLIAKLHAQAFAQGQFNAWIYLLSEKELQVYLDALKLKPIEESPLWGIPFAIKDNIDLKNVPTSAGCEAFTYTPGQSATVVELLIDAGAIPLGKTNLDQFATGLVGTRSPFGEGKNVFNPDYISGGSSAGSAIATALGQVSFALGTDTAGSGRVPAAFNNLIGHKPTKGLLSTCGVVPACKSLDCVSIFALTTEDAVRVLDVATLADDNDPYSRKNIAFNTRPYWTDKIKGAFRFGIPDQLEFDDVRAEELFHIACQQLEALGGQSVTIDFEPFMKTARLLYEGPWVAERAWATQDVSPSAMLPVIQDILATTKKFRVTDVFDAQYKLQALKRICDHELDKVDFVVTPTTPTCYLRSEIAKQPVALNSKLGTYTNFMNLLDYAATAIPVGRLSSQVSWGVTLFGRAFTDIRLLSFAGALQRQLNLPLGATSFTLSPQTENASRLSPEESVAVVVCGAHLSGQPLNWQLQDRGATLKRKTRTTQAYALFALPDGKRPALVQAEPGSAIEVEVWQLPMAEFGSFVAGIPSPLGIGKVTLETGECLPGFICEEGGIADAENISNFGGWRAYLEEKSRIK